MTELMPAYERVPISDHEPERALRVISYGGGVQSTALLALAAKGAIDFPTFLFSNVGDDSENPGTLRYITEFASPFAQQHGIALEVLDKVRRDGRRETLWQHLHRPETRSIPIPVRMANGAPGRRNCTADFKIKVISRWLRHHGATAETPATVGIGISLDEIHRANRRRAEPNQRVSYPLLDLRLRREDCIRLIQEAGLPVPPKSSCFFCPFHTVDEWRTQRANDPELFSRSEDLERFLNLRRAALGRDDVYLTRYGIPLGTAIQSSPGEDCGDGDCDSGWCMT
ncbi:phosphoadenosine phosphosulfate reductase [Streptomyces sp. NPDC059176]|uniref:phosphoadenosine phosphosulfate reductase n=1 Tax=Streptomyces sp. NPDC059176 TaxID=3346758 RepID=UPI0036B75067